MAVPLYEFVYTISHHENKSTQNTHMVICVALPRRNDPILELFDVGHSGDEDLRNRLTAMATYMSPLFFELRDRLNTFLVFVR